MISEYNVTGNIVEEIMKKIPFVWKLKDKFYAINRQQCCFIPDTGSLLVYEYEQYLKDVTELGYSYHFDKVNQRADLYILSRQDISDTKSIFDSLESTDIEDLNLQLTYFVNSYKMNRNT